MNRERSQAEEEFLSEPRVQQDRKQTGGDIEVDQIPRLPALSHRPNTEDILVPEEVDLKVDFVGLLSEKLTRLRRAKDGIRALEAQQEETKRLLRE